MGKNKNLLITYKLAFGMLGLSAIATEIAVLLHQGAFVSANFFSFFTVQSNVFAAATLLGSAWVLGRGKPRTADMWRGAATLYMVVTGIIFALLLSGLDPGVLTAVPWDNTVLHYIVPIAVFVDWLLDPPTRRIPFSRALLWLAYPLLYLVYVVVRGHFVHWYPYPFLNVAQKGYVPVLGAAAGVAAIVLLLAWLLTKTPVAGRK